MLPSRLVRLLALHRLAVRRSCADAADKSMPPMSNAASHRESPPTTCCGSGCANCVWIEYAQRLTDSISVEQRRSVDDFLANIDQHIDDPSVRAFVAMELREKLAKLDDSR